MRSNIDKGNQREMLLPSLLAIAVPVAVGLIFGVPVVGLLMGGMTTGFYGCIHGQCGWCMG